MSQLNNDVFEKIIIYNILTDATYLASVVDYIKPDYFNNKISSVIIEIVSEFYDKRHVLPTITEVKTKIVKEGHQKAFKALVESFSSLNKNFNKSELYENTEKFLKEKAVYHTLLEVAKDVSKSNVDTGIILDKFEKSCNIDLSTNYGINIFENIDSLVDDFTKTNETIPSNWKWLDDVIQGGWMANGRALYVFAGETNIGKSIFLGNAATNIASQRKNVLVITLEMSELLYSQRLCANITKIPLKNFKSDSPTLKQLLKEEKHKNGNILIKEFPPSTITPKQLQAFVQKVYDSGLKLDAVVVDYLNLINSPIGSNSYERIKYVTEQIRAMSYIFSCPVISATQINRTGFGQDNPDMTTISESIGIAATADVIVSIYQNEEDRELGIIRMGLMKNRFGIRGITQAMNIDYSNLTISQAEEIIEDNNADIMNTLTLLGGV
jgi:replicative DNA helicase